MVNYSYTFLDYGYITAFWNFLSYEEVDCLGTLDSNHKLYEYLKLALDKINKEHYNYEIILNINSLELIKNPQNIAFQNDFVDNKKLIFMLLLENGEKSLFIRGNSEEIIEAPWHRGCLLIFPAFVPYKFSKNTKIILKGIIYGNEPFK